MNKVTIQSYSITIVKTDDGKFLLIDKHENSRIANDSNELVKIIKELFEKADNVD